MSTLTDEQLLRYSRHILLPEIGDEGQQKLLDSTALVVGLGGLGSPAAIYLAASGVGKLILADDDVVELSNLQRQIVHTTATIGIQKTESASKTLRQINPDVTIESVGRVDLDVLPEIVKQADIVIDGSDNFATRYAVNRTCHQLTTPLVSAAVIRMEGQVSVFMQREQDACYECLYPDHGRELEESCVQSGVLAPVAGMIGSIQATEAIKVLVGTGKTLSGSVLLLDMKHFEWRTVALKKNKQCTVCSKENTMDDENHGIGIGNGIR